MRVLLGTLIAAVATGGAAVCAGPGQAPAVGVVTLSPGDPAPPFTLKGSDGLTYRLADYHGKQAVVLAWIAKAFSGG